MATKTATPEAKVARLTEETAIMLSRAEDYSIVTAPEYVEGGTVLKRIKTKMKELKELRQSMTRPIDETKRRILALFSEPEGQLADAEQVIKGAMLSYQNEQERIRAAEEARLRDLAEQERLKLLERAKKAAEKGKEEKAADLEEQAETLPVPIVTSAQPKVEGISTRVTWHAEVLDKDMLIKAVAEGKVPSIVLEPNMTILNQQARALKEALNYPGVAAMSDQTVAAGRGTAPPRLTPRG